MEWRPAPHIHDGPENRGYPSEPRGSRSEYPRSIANNIQGIPRSRLRGPSPAENDRLRQSPGRTAAAYDTLTKTHRNPLPNPIRTETTSEQFWLNRTTAWPPSMGDTCCQQCQAWHAKRGCATSTRFRQLSSCSAPSHFKGCVSNRRYSQLSELSARSPIFRG